MPMRKVQSVVSLDGFRIDVDEPLLPRLSSHVDSPDSLPVTTRFSANCPDRRDARSPSASHKPSGLASNLGTDRGRGVKRRIEWLQLDHHGQEATIYADKRTLCAQKGLKPPVRDLRVLDPAFISPGHGYLLARDRCLIMALEHVRIIIMKDKVLIPLHRSDRVDTEEARITHQLQQQLIQALRKTAKVYGATGGSMEEAGSIPRTSTYSNLDLGDSLSDRLSPSQPSHLEEKFSSHKPTHSTGHHPGFSPRFADPAGRMQPIPDGTATIPSNPFTDAIPFEQAILDTALSEVVRRLSHATAKLDANRKIVDELTSSVDRETLVSVRMLKNKQQELLDRVTVVVDQLEHTAEERTLGNMCLAHKDATDLMDTAFRTTAATQHSSSTGLLAPSTLTLHPAARAGAFGGVAGSLSGPLQGHPFTADPAPPQGPPGGAAAAATAALPASLAVATGDTSSGCTTGVSGRTGAAETVQSAGEAGPSRSGTCSSPRSPVEAAVTLALPAGRASGVFQRDQQVSHAGLVSELDEREMQRHLLRDMFQAHMQNMEALVESHFIEAHSCQHKLESLGKYITDVEAFVNIHMDAVRNRMIKFEILLMTATFALGIYAVVAGVLGENLPIAPHRLTLDEESFVIINVVTTILCMMIFISTLVCARRNGLV